MLKKILSAFTALLIANVSANAQCPVPDAGPDQSVCVGSTVTLGAVLPPSFMGTWTKAGAFGGIGTPGTFADNTDPATDVTGLTSARTVQYIWTVTDQASCANLRDTVTISVQAPVTSADAGNNRTVCANGTATLGATLQNGNSGSWSIGNSINNGTIVFSDPSSPQANVTGLYNQGKDTLIWTVTNNLCGGSESDFMVITVNQAPAVANAGTDIKVCQGDTVQLNGSVATFGSPSWVLPTGSGATFLGGSSNDTVKLRGATAAGAISVAYRISSSTGATVLNGCLSVDTVVVTFGPSNANAGPDQKICVSGKYSVVLAGNPPAAGETGKWTILKGVGFAALRSQTVCSTSVVGITADTLILRWTLTSGACSDYDDVTIIRIGAAPTVAAVGADITGCVGDTVKLIGSKAVSGNPSWTRQPSGGLFDVNPINIPFMPTNGNNDTISVALRTAGTYKLFYTISVNNQPVGSTCATRDSLQLFVNARPQATILTNNTTVCDGQTTFTVTADKPNAGIGAWSKSSGLGTLTKLDSVAVISGVTNGSATLTWTVNDGVCTASRNVTVTSLAPPTIANAGIDKQLCAGDTIKLLGNIAVSGDPTWSVGFLNSFTIRFASDANNDTVLVTTSSNATAGSYPIFYSINAGGANCTTRDTMNLEVVKCVVGVEENTSNIEINILPNPASGKFTLSVLDTEFNELSYSIITMDGHVVKHEKFGLVSDLVKGVDVSDISSGVYIVQLIKGSKYYFHKLLIQ